MSHLKCRMIQSLNDHARSTLFGNFLNLSEDGSCSFTAIACLLFVSTHWISWVHLSLLMSFSFMFWLFKFSDFAFSAFFSFHWLWWLPKKFLGWKWFCYIFWNDDYQNICNSNCLWWFISFLSGIRALFDWHTLNYWGKSSLKAHKVKHCFSTWPNETWERQ